MNPVLDLLTKRIRELDKEIQILQRQVDNHRRVYADKEVEILMKEAELTSLLNHARELSRKEKEANGGS
ncbi:hypothetical protein SHEEN_42 [Mycobacterium phage Sheen]|uniref:Uncharacterized protein n=1 Tax=Mycobacterium phage Sheen TaxID=1589274 RepID=A0A0B5A468_9CAUD|nr:hypothetical protein AVV31_gp52 [Mycobacterium phage Sheen]AJD82460.1 hypothetical protein SHEEN_42 [Mycobacterium phage Sheen]